jgi:hypothetical protein
MLNGLMASQWNSLANASLQLPNNETLVGKATLSTWANGTNIKDYLEQRY